ncbi:inhibitor of nuclear factor kappa-B kinase-interacting protein isoform X3 [Carassius auratus]|uniref:Inhibitor of nuclear factor kappa-B kinase-interacting protein isoform X3 n=1 Tax=Carassius auratus TaxID=7957 RepID=A0A6P6MDD3_CARAU|nr:uncharacterized protein LOC113066806 isoform X3 [Carassius auratus]
MMQASGARQRQKSVMKQPSGEKKSGSEERSSSRFSPDVKLCVALVCLSVSLFSTWLHVQQDAKLAEIILKHERLSEESRSLHELREHMAGLSRELQTSSSSCSTLKHAVSSTLNTSAALQVEQQASAVLLHTLEERVRRVTEARRRALSEELEQLKRRSRAAHSHVTEQVNTVEALLRELSERLQEVQDGVGRNTRALVRSEDEDAGHVSDQLQWSERRVSRLQEQLQRLEEQGLELRQRLDTRAPHHTHLHAADEAVRSMLRVRAQLSTTYRRLEELQVQVQSAEERLRSTPHHT